MDIWNSQLRVTKKATSGTVYALADPEFMGVISVRIDLDQMDEDASRLSVMANVKLAISVEPLVIGQYRGKFFRNEKPCRDCTPDSRNGI